MLAIWLCNSYSNLGLLATLGLASFVLCHISQHLLELFHCLCLGSGSLRSAITRCCHWSWARSSHRFLRNGLLALRCVLGQFTSDTSSTLFGTLFNGFGVTGDLGFHILSWRVFWLWHTAFFLLVDGLHVQDGCATGLKSILVEHFASCKFDDALTNIGLRLELRDVW